jgi:hypothetical protein
MFQSGSGDELLWETFKVWYQEMLLAPNLVHCQNLDSQILNSQNIDSQNLDRQNLDSQNLDSQYREPTLVEIP